MVEQREWKDVVLQDLAAPTRHALVGGPFGSELLSSDQTPDGVPVIRGENLSLGRWVGGDFVFVSQEKARQLAANTAGPLDVVFTQRGANHYRQVALIPADADRRFVVSQSQMKLTVDPAKADPLFVYYLFRAPAQQEYLRRNAIQTGVPHTNLSILRNTPLRIPTLAEQHAIAGILGTLDDKIELNHRMNETLEALSHVLFNSWFVDFQPVRAKSECRETGLTPHLTDLFPDSFQGSELGEIPAGWRVSRLGNEVETFLGGTPSRAKQEFWDGDIPWINSGKANEFRIIDPSELITRAGLMSSATKLLPPRTTVIAITGATLGQVSLTEIQTCANQSIVGVLGSESLPSEFLYPWVETNIERLISSQTGGAQQHINKNDVNELPVLCPSGPVIGAYVDRVRPLFDRIREGCFETRHLEELRDSLLPKLIGGEIRTGPAERHIFGRPG